MKERALKIANRLDEIGRVKDMGRPPIKDTEREAATLIRELQSRLEDLEQEIQEQCRIIGMSAERELRMAAKMEELDKENASLKQDAKRLDWLEASEDSHGFCHSGYGEYRYYAHQVNGFKSVREVIDTAMQTNKEANA